MEKRIGTITILLRDREAATAVNRLLSEHADIILCRQGLPFHDLSESREENELVRSPEVQLSGLCHRPVAVISLIVEGSVDSINALTGKLGRVEGVECKAVVSKNS